MQKKSLKKVQTLFVGILMLLLTFGLISTFTSSPTLETISYNEFEKAVADNKVEQVYLNPNKPNEKMVVTMADGANVYTQNPDLPTLKADLVKAGVNVEIGGKSIFSNGLVQIIIGFTVVGLIFAFFNARNAQRGAMGRSKTIASNDEMLKKAKETAKRATKFSSIAGNEDAKEDLWESVSYLKNPKRFVEAGVRLPSGILLHGPSGTGKTLMARAVAGEAGVPFFAVSGSDFLERFVGVGASRVRDLFEEVRKAAPSVLFIDEADSLLRIRGNNTSDEAVQTVNQFLVEMDGFSSNTGIIVIAATNRKDMIDPAVLRPGRFDRHVKVDLPEKEARKAILELHARNKRIGADVDFARLAKSTTGFSGADLENLLNESALLSLRRDKKEISWKEIQDAIEYVILGSRPKGAWSKEETELVAYHEAGHAIVTHLIAKQGMERITVNPAGNAGGYVLRSPKDNRLKTRKEFYHDILISMAGRVAESIIYGEDNVTTGAQDDFRKASRSAMQMVFAFGMSDLGPIAVTTTDENMWHTLSEDMKNKAQTEMNTILQRAEKEVTDFLNENRELLERLTQHLLKYKTIDGDSIQEVLDGTWVEPKVEVVEEEKKVQIPTINSEEVAVLAIEEQKEEK